MNIELTETELEFVAAYFAAIDFTETGDIDQPESGEELDADFKRESILDCLSFLSRIWCYMPSDRISDAGHDFAAHVFPPTDAGVFGDGGA